MVAHKEINASEVESACASIIQQLIEHHARTERLLIVGIVDGGTVLSQRIGLAMSKALGREIPIGQVNIDFYRDDIGQTPITAPKAITEIPIDVNDATVLLVDDVLHTGRSARAAINEIFDSGRPKRLELISLIDRGHRMLPIHPDYLGFRENIPAKQQVHVKLNLVDPKQDKVIIK